MANRVTTRGYFKKRLVQSGYKVLDIFDKYNELDTRAWTIMIDPGVDSIMCTCQVNIDGEGKSFIELYDNGRFIPSKIKICTESIEVIMDLLNTFDLVQKRDTYTNQQSSCQ